jgi:hypothetical protein
VVVEQVITANRILQEIFNVKNVNRENAGSLITFNLYIKNTNHKVSFLDSGVFCNKNKMKKIFNV